MPIYDDDYLDDILRGLSMSDEHKHNVRKLQKRFNLPDDDILFLYLASLEYTVKLCEDILGGINTERTAMEQSARVVQAVGSEQAEAIIKQMIEASQGVIAKFQESGMAATSAIAEANGEVLNKSRETIRSAIELKNQITALRDSVEHDRETNIKVLKVLLERMGQSIGSQNSAIQELNNAKKDINQLQKGMTIANTSRWFSPLTALLVVFLVGIGTGWWYWSLKWNDSLSVLGRNLVNWNASRILKCQKDHNPKCTLWIVTPPEQRQ